jgi:pimeloyl-ACP methyl ester carboxylesterase
MSPRALFPLITLSLVAVGCSPRFHQVKHVHLLQPAEVLQVPTDDGATLTLHHYPPRGTPASTLPVLVCHGIASNTHTWALGPDRDIGDHLASAGYDTYLVDLRGHGASGPAAASTSIDTYARHDVPAAIGHVLQLTGADQAVWVGHSMGGLVLIAFLQGTADPRLAAAVTVASPADWRGETRLTGVIHRVLRLLAIPGPLPARTLAGFYADWEGDIPMSLDRVVYEPSNMDRAMLADMMRVGLSPIQAGVREQFARSMEAGAFVSADGSVDYLAGAQDITLPFLVIAGRVDHLSPPERTVTFFDQLGSKDKTWRVFGLDQGDHADYGHVDLCNGDHAAEDVYPFITAWLAARIDGR